MNRSLCCAAVVLLSLVGTRVAAEEPADAVLVKKLGDPAFPVREQAEQELRRRGRAAAAALRQGTRAGDAEVRRRCVRLLSLAERSELDVALDAFEHGRDDVKLPLPGWAAFRKYAGDDAAGRSAYVLIFRDERDVLETLERDPKALAARLRSGPTIELFPDGSPKILTKTAVLLLCAGVAKNEGKAPVNLFQILDHGPVYSEIANHAGAQRLVERWMERQVRESNVGPQLAALARLYRCDDFVDRRLKPVLADLVEKAAADPLNPERLDRALSLANNLKMTEMVDAKLKPAVRKAFKERLGQPAEIDRLLGAAQIMHTIGGMEDEVKAALAPVLPEICKKLDVSDDARFSTVVALGELAQRIDIVARSARPELRRLMLDWAAKPADLFVLANIALKARGVGLDEDVDTIAAPALVRKVQTLVERGAEAELEQAAAVAQLLNLEESLRPAARQFFEKASREQNSLARLSTSLTFARALQLDDLDELIQRKLKPAVRKAALVRDQTFDPIQVVHTLAMLEELQAREGVGFAIRVACAKKTPPSTSAQALQLVIRLGTKEHVPLLEPLLTDAQVCSFTEGKGKNFTTQVGDVALAAAILLSGQKLEAFGFPLAATNDDQTILVGFENDGQRAATLQKWRAVKKN